MSENDGRDRKERVVTDTYFRRLAAETPTRVWVNNPTIAEMTHAIVEGAVGCTTNPAYGGGLLKRAPDEIRPVIDQSIRDIPNDSDRVVADLVQRRLVARVTERFAPIYGASGGRYGYVSIQGAPEEDTDGDRIWQEAQEARQIGPNATPKIPATEPGFEAFEKVVARGWPVIVTEVFSLDQLAFACKRYVAVTSRTCVRPPFFISPITGILGDHLKKVAAQEGLEVSAGEVELAGVYLARRCADFVARGGYPVTLLFGGARGIQDMTGLVGAAHHATINWSTFAELIALDPPLKSTISEAPDQEILARLLDLFPDLWRGWELGRLAVEEFEMFGPVQHFRYNFIAGWRAVLAEIHERRSVAVQTTRHAGRSE